jgi:hypothetical protein
MQTTKLPLFSQQIKKLKFSLGTSSNGAIVIIIIETIEKKYEEIMLEKFLALFN